MADKPVDILIDHKPSELPPATAANYVSMAFSGPEIQMILGYLDLHQFAEAVQKASKHGSRVTVSATPTHRVMLSQRGFALLRQQVDQVSKQLDQARAAQRAHAAAARPDQPPVPSVPNAS